MLSKFTVDFDANMMTIFSLINEIDFICRYHSPKNFDKIQQEKQKIENFLKNYWEDQFQKKENLIKKEYHEILWKIATQDVVHVITRFTKDAKQKTQDDDFETKNIQKIFTSWVYFFNTRYEQISKYGINDLNFLCFEKTTQLEQKLLAYRFSDDFFLSNQKELFSLCQKYIVEHPTFDLKTHEHLFNLLFDFVLNSFIDNYTFLNVYPDKFNSKKFNITHIEQMFDVIYKKYNTFTQNNPEKISDEFSLKKASVSI